MMGCIGDDKEAPDNYQCELSCSETFASDIPKSISKAEECLEDCDNPDDRSCIQDCEEIEYGPSEDFVMCTGGCPCAVVLLNCATKCDDEKSCLMDCAAELNRCQGDETTYMCSLGCDSDKFDCNWNCEDEWENADDMTGYIECWQECNEEIVECAEECI
ncbi:MAG: hypothetical protein OCD01_14625 [Fibrobacterales bacterium]